MQVLYWPNSVSFLAFDVDETVYPKNEDYFKHQRKIELTAIAGFWGISEAAAASRLAEKSQVLETSLGRKPSAAEVIRSVEGLSQDWLVRVRSENWHPELFLRPHPELPELMAKLTSVYRVAFASTSPRAVLDRVFQAVGFQPILSKVEIFGGGDALPKPSPDIYHKVAQRFALPPAEGLSIGDRIDFDARPAIEAGMGAVVVQGMDDLVEVIKILLKEVLHG